MKTQGKFGWVRIVCIALTIGLGALVLGRAQIGIQSEEPAGDEQYVIEFVKMESPPMPPVMLNGKLVPWSEAYGPSLPEFVPIKRLKNPKPPAPYDPENKWVEIKRRLAPWMTEEQLHDTKLPQSATLEAARRRAMLKGGFHPKVDLNAVAAESKKALAARKLSADQLSALPTGENSSLNNSSSSPTLNLVRVEFLEGYTRYDLWVTDAPVDQWFEVYYCDTLDPQRWILAHTGEPEDGYGTSLQKYTVYVGGNPSQGYFQLFPGIDSDGDGLTDGMEVAVFKTDPGNPDSASLRDSDKDGLPDFPNMQNNYVVDGDEDSDQDGISNLKEIQMGIDPLVPQNNLADYDSDGLPDWAENLIWIYQGIPNPGLRGDSDEDGVDNYTEVAVQSDPSWPDRVYNYAIFNNLTDVQRAFITPPITVQHTDSRTRSAQMTWFTMLQARWAHTFILKSFGTGMPTAKRIKVSIRFF